jgi:zinc resistance-associated protein
MLKPVLAATAIIAIAGSSFVYAQQRFGDRRGFDGNGPRVERRHQMSQEDRAAFVDARIAALKAGLELTQDQTKNWPAFEQALRDMVQLQAQRRQARLSGDQPTPTSPFDRMSRRADNMSKTSAALKKIADAGAPLYMSLTDTQKARFTSLARILRPHQHRDGNRGWRQGSGYGRDGRGMNPDGARPDGRGQDGRGWGHGRRFGDNDQGPNGPVRPLMGEGGGNDQDTHL